MFDMQFGISIDDLLKMIDQDFTKSVRLIRTLQDLDFGVHKIPLSVQARVATASSAAQWVNIALAQNQAQGLPQGPRLPITNCYEDPLLTGDKMQSIYTALDPNETPVVLDTGASFSLTPFKSDFVGTLRRSEISTLKGLSSTTTVEGIGTVEWTIRDVFGLVRTIRVSAYYVPSATVRLFSPQVYFQENNNRGVCRILARKVLMNIPDCPDGTLLEFPINAYNNLPLMLTQPTNTKLIGVTEHDVTTLGNATLMAGLLSVADQTNQNLSQPQKEFLLWHQRLGHSNLQWNQTLMRTPENVTAGQGGPYIVTRHPTCSRVKTDRLVCTACALSKQRRRNPNHRTQVQQTEEGIIRNDLEVGQRVSIDQYMSALPGRLPNTKGKEPKKDKYVGGTIFVDHASQFIHLENQVTLNVGDTIRSKKKFEHLAHSFGRKIRTYRADNVPFGAAAFRDHVAQNNQTIDFSGVGAHFQNGVAERAIQTATSWARTILLHATIMWPDQANLELWPFALQHAVFLWNNMPRKDSRLSPLEVFSGVKHTNYDHLQRLHVWGCPVYVLDPKLQYGKKLPKWNPRTRRGQYLGYSPEHSSLIGRILNITTGSISPQYHGVYDDLFTSVPNSESGGIFDTSEFNATSWARLVETGLERHLSDDPMDPLPSLGDTWLTPAERDLRFRLRHARRARRLAARRNTPSEGEQATLRPLQPQAVTPPPQAQAPSNNGTEGANFDGTNDDSDDDSLPAMDETDAEADTNSLVDEGDIPTAVQQPLADADTIRTRSGRISKKPQRLIETLHVTRNDRSGKFKPTSYEYGKKPSQSVKSGDLNQQFLMALKWNQVVETIRSKDLAAMMTWMDQHMDPNDGTIEEWHPMALASLANASDNPTWDQAMNGPDKAGYWDACKKELQTLIDKECWDEVVREDWMNVLPGTWAFKCKRFPTGLVRKLKARFCARGDKQLEGVDYFDTFAPVTNWMTVRLMLTLSTILGLATQQVDYTAAFIHAPIGDDEVFVDMPRGFAKAGMVLRLKKSIYGLKQSPRNFFLHLKGKLEEAGLQSNPEVDPCLFVSDKVICLVYVDDTLFFSPDPKYIKEVTDKLRNLGMELEEEDSVAGFLGVDIARDERNSSIKLTQRGLAKRVVEALNVGHMPRKLTPASHEPLVKDDLGDPPDGNYNYASVIGMLQYLQGHSRPDITYAVSQCARFTHSPKRSHEQALERIGQYLKHTLDEGLIMQPSQNLDIDCYVDADFAGLWPHEDKLDPISVKSRTGFVLCIAECPIIWMSKIQDSIALSTMEAEYNALSVAMKSVLPLQRIFKALASGLGFTREQQAHFKTTVWEDNQGALALANLEPGRVTPRSKHYAIKYHWFRSHIKPNKVDVKRIDTNNQKADILTKGLRTHQFQSIRKLLCGW